MAFVGLNWWVAHSQADNIGVEMFWTIASRLMSLGHRQNNNAPYNVV